jgi:hypothetical protein
VPPLVRKETGMDTRDARMRPAAILLTVLGAWASGGCATDGPEFESVGLTPGRASTQLGLGRDGAIVGPTMALSATRNGYHGMADSAIVDLRFDGDHIVGTMSDRMVDLHLIVSDDGLRLQGLLAGRLGHLDASNYGIRSAFGPCAYDLEVVGGRYEGKRACNVRGGFPVISPTAVALPPGFARLPTIRQAMLLAILLSQ